MAIISASGALSTKQNARPSELRRSQIAESQKFSTSQIVGESIDESLTGTGTFVQDIQSERLSRTKFGNDESKLSGFSGLYVDVFGVEAEDKKLFATKEDYLNSDVYSPTIPYRPSLTRGEARIMRERELERNKYGSMLEQANTAETIAAFTAGLGAAIVEPKNLVSGIVAAGIVRAPIVGLSNTSARYTALRNYMNSNLGKYGTAGAVAARAAGEGAIAVAITEGSNRESALALGDDYTMTDTIMNFATSIAFGAAIEGAPVIFKTFKSAKKVELARKQARELAATKLKEKGIEFNQKLETGELKGIEVKGVVAEQLRGVDYNTHAKASELAQAQILKGQRVDVAPVLAQGKTQPAENVADFIANTNNQLQGKAVLLQKDNNTLAVKTTANIGKKQTAATIDRLVSYADVGNFRLEIPATTNMNAAALKQAGFRKQKDIYVRKPVKQKPSEKLSTAEVKGVVDSLDNPKKSSTYNEQAVKSVDDYLAKFSSELDETALQREIDEIGLDIAELQRAGLLDAADKDILEFQEKLIQDAEEYSNSIEKASFCLTRG